MTTKTTISDTEYATLWYYPDPKIVHHRFHKPIKGEEFRQVLLKGLDIFRQNGAQKWLSDDRLNASLPVEDSDWGQQQWFPQVFAAGWKFWAIVLPDKVFGRMNMQNFIKAYSEQGLTIEVFGDMDEAMKWLEAV